MSPAVVLVAGLVGLLVGSVVWVIARNQSGRRPLLSAPLCDPLFRVSISRHATPAPADDDNRDDDEPAPAPANSCGATLPGLAWLPLFGFGTAARCPSCGRSQTRWRLVFELLAALYFAVAAWRLDGWRDLVPVLAFAVPLLVILLVDLWTRLIYTNVILVGLILALALSLLDGVEEIVWSAGAAIGAVVIFAIFFLMAKLIYPNAKVVPFGLGDIYLAAMIGAMARSAVVPAIFYGIVAAALGAIFLLVSGRAGRRQAMPYGPYLVLGALVALIA